MGMRPKEISQSEKILRNLFSSEELYSIIEQITGDRPMKYSQLFLSQYRKGCFLAPHSDINRGKWAFVLNMTKDWKPQYGGLNGFRKGIKLTASWFEDIKNMQYYKNNSYTV